MSVKIRLNKREEDLVLFLNSAVNQMGIDGLTLRIAGGWVRDKV